VRNVVGNPGTYTDIRFSFTGTRQEGEEHYYYFFNGERLGMCQWFETI